MAQGADGVELDAWRCGSGEVVVIHDEDTARTCGERLVVPDAPLARLRALDAGRCMGGRFAGERLPLLAEVLEALPGAVVNVELKARPGRADVGLAREVAAVIAAARAEARVLVSSFDFGLVAAFRAVAPGVATGLLFEPSWHRGLRVPLAVRRLAPSALNPDLALCAPARLAGWVASPRAVYVWTVDGAADVARLARAGAAALICNAPGAARSVVREACGR
jgi:glycerophosphoryl diester phosphodiesterase